MTAHGLPTMHKYVLSIKQFTVQVDVDGLNYINWTAPITGRFVKQPLNNLEKWMQKLDSAGFSKTKIS